MLALSLALIFLLTGSAAADAAAESGIPELLRLGQFHGDEVSAKDGERWWALVARGGSFVLERRTIHVRVEHDEIVDEPGKQTGKRVAAPGDGDALVLLRGIAGLRAGPVDAQRPEPTRLFPGERCLLRVGGGGELFATGAASIEAWEPRIRDYSLWLQVSGGRQELASLPSIDSHPPELVWAGDLDHDGKLDLIVDLGHHYDVSEWAIFLSSAAAPGEHVGRVASFPTVGC